MTKSKGIGRGRGRTRKEKEPEPLFRDSPHYWLKKYKTTQRPRPCERCRQNAYYYHDYFGYLCAAHLLDLVNIGEMLWKWNEFPEVWDRTEQLLRRPTPYIGVDAMNERE